MHLCSIRRRGPRVPLLVLVLGLSAGKAYAQGVATEGLIDSVTISGNRAPLDPNLPTTSESRTAAQLREQNFVNVEDALKYLPDVTVRKRYIGDRNALVGGRSASNLQAPRALVYADGYLLSQFLGQFNAPRWNVVAPEELARVDVLYGPFSALYPGNSIGTTVILTTRQPKAFEASARVQSFRQHVEDAGYSGSYAGHQESAFLGNKVGAFTYVVALNRLRNRGQPMQYVTLQTPATGALPGTPVSGAVPGVDQTGKPWYLLGPNGSAIENNTQQQVKLKLGVDLAPGLYGEALYTRWTNEGRRHGESLLRDAGGNPVTSGLVSIDGVRYNVPAGAFAPQYVEETHDLLGVKLTTRRKAGWNASVVATLYDIRTDIARTANGYAGGPGTLADNGGTGWTTIDLQSTYTPGADGQHALAFGLHSNRYELASRTDNTADWRHGDVTSPVSRFGGKTALQALFAQDTWKFAPDWRLTTGLRYERWKAFDGSRAGTGAAVPYPERVDSAWSPKASVSYAGWRDWIARLSLGKGVRFPTVSELFQGSVAGSAIINNNAGLAPELSYAKELSAERQLAFGTVRVSLFADDVRDTIYSQTNITVFPNVTNIQNIDRVRTRGLEVSSQLSDVGVRGLDVTANAAWSRGEILANSRNPTLIGKTWVRVPRLRANVFASYRFDQRWMASLGVRHSGRQYNNLDNSDIRPDVFGGTSRYTVWDTKLTWRVADSLEASLGVDNLTNARYYVFHPYPGRTFIGELHARFH